MNRFYISIVNLVTLGYKQPMLDLLEPLWVFDHTDYAAGTFPQSMARAAGVVSEKCLEKLIGRTAGIDSRGSERRVSSSTDQVLFAWISGVELRWGDDHKHIQVSTLESADCHAAFRSKRPAQLMKWIQMREDIVRASTELLSLNVSAVSQDIIVAAVGEAALQGLFDEAHLDDLFMTSHSTTWADDSQKLKMVCDYCEKREEGSATRLHSQLRMIRHRLANQVASEK